MSTLSSSSRHGGFSLIEVAIALAIFVFGALAIVQIFPPALGVIRNNESRTTATQLSESTLAQLSTKTTPPPEAIFDVDPASTQPYKWNDYPAAVVGTINKNASLPKSPIDSTSALDHFKFIYGEPHYIGSSQTVFSNRPISNTVTPTAFYDRIIEGVQINEDGDLSFANAYMSDGTELNETEVNGVYYDAHTPFNNGSTRPPESSTPDRNYRRTSDPSTNVTYYVSYRWREAATPNIIRGVIEEPLSIPSDSGWIDNPARVLACAVDSANKAVPGGVRVKMRKSIPASSSSIGSTVSISASIPGLYYINYLSKDWRELSVDSAPVNNVVQLPINGIEENSVFGVLTNSNYTLKPPVASSGPYPIASVDYKKGSVTYSFPPTPGARIRTTYRTLDGWANQPSVAPRSYIPYIVRPTAIGFSEAHFPREPWREYVWIPGERIIYFHASEAGKSISVSYQSSTGTIVKGAVLTIRDAQKVTTLPAGFFGSANPDRWVAPAEITDLSGNPIAASAILSIQGLSIQARTAWQNGDRYNQVIVPGYRTLMQ